CLQYNSRPFTF
nr:immunoglobulin light chain junction region [Macaca mulatta]